MIHSYFSHDYFIKGFIPKDIHPTLTLLSTNITKSTLPLDFRFTSLKHTLIDILIAAHADAFKGTPFSSVSELVRMFSRTHRFFCQ